MELIGTKKMMEVQMWDGVERRKISSDKCSEHSGMQANYNALLGGQLRIEASMNEFHNQMRAEITEIKRVAVIATEMAGEVKNNADTTTINGNRITRLETQMTQGRSWLYGITLAVLSVILWVLKKTL